MGFRVQMRGPKHYFSSFFFFFFNDTATTEIYTLSLHDALPIRRLPSPGAGSHCRHPASGRSARVSRAGRPRWSDRKSTRLNSSHVEISYAVFCLKKKKKAKFRPVKQRKTNKHTK